MSKKRNAFTSSSDVLFKSPTSKPHSGPVYGLFVYFGLVFLSNCSKTGPLCLHSNGDQSTVKFGTLNNSGFQMFPGFRCRFLDDDCTALVNKTYFYPRKCVGHMISIDTQWSLKFWVCLSPASPEFELLPVLLRKCFRFFSGLGGSKNFWLYLLRSSSSRPKSCLAQQQQQQQQQHLLRRQNDQLPVREIQVKQEPILVAQIPSSFLKTRFLKFC